MILKSEPDKVVELVPEQTEPVAEETQQPEDDIKLEITVGSKTDGNLYFLVKGNAYLVEMEGLLMYARKQLDRLWDQALRTGGGMNAES